VDFCINIRNVLYEKEVAMKFPISVMRVDDYIVLLQCKITPDFKRRLKQVNTNISSQSNPQLAGHTIFINGDYKQRNYEFVRDRYTDAKFNRYLEIINEAKRTLGYDE
jgi:hypothetical protein